MYPRSGESQHLLFYRFVKELREADNPVTSCHLVFIKKHLYHRIN